MKKYFPLLFFFCMVSYVYSQQIQGVIYYQNSGGQTAANVQVTAFGCDTEYTQSNGMFILPCPQKAVGQKVKLIIGNIDGDGKNIEVVNSRQLDWLRIPNEFTGDPIEIIICYAGQRDQIALRFYGILAKSTTKEFEQKVNDLEAQLQKNTLNANERRILISQIDKLKVERDVIIEKLEEQAEFIANINKDQASELVKSAIQKIETEEDISAALEILDDNKLEEAYYLVLDKKIKAEVEIKKIIHGYELKINLLLPNFRYTDAIKCYEKIIEIQENNNFNKEELASLYGKLGNVIFLNGEYKKALHNYQESMKIRKKLLKPNHPDIAQSHNDIALAYFALGEYEKSLDFNQKSLNIRRDTLVINHIEISESYNNIGLVYQLIGKYEKALDFFLRANEIKTKKLDSKHSSIATSYNNIAVAFHSLGRYEKALEYHKKAIIIREETLTSNHPDLAQSFNNIATTYQFQGQYEKALKNQQKSIEIREKSLSQLHPDLAISYNNIGNIYKDLEQYKKAFKYEQKAIDIQEKIFDKNHLALAGSYDNIANTYTFLGEYDKAIEYHKKSISIQEIGIEKNYPNLAISYSNFGKTYYVLEQYENALEYQQKAIASQEKNLNYNHHNLGLYYFNLASTYAKLKRFDEAVTWQEKCLSNFKKSLPLEHPKQELAFNAWLEFINGRAIKAYEDKDYSSALNDFSLIGENIENGLVWNGIATCHYYLLNYSKAIEAYHKAATLSPEIKTQHFFHSLGMAYVRNNQFKEAFNAFLEYEKLFPTEGKTHYNWAVYFALQKERTKSLYSLQKAIKLGFKDIEMLKNDYSMDILRKENEFIEIIKKLEEGEK